MSWLTRFGKNLKRSCRNISLHGFINISESKSVLEMTFWLCVQALCFVLCLWLMAIHWLRYQSRPTVTTIKSTAYPISDIPFPAVTVCNSNVVHKKKILYYETLLWVFFSHFFQKLFFYKFLAVFNTCSQLI